LLDIARRVEADLHGRKLRDDRHSQGLVVGAKGVLKGDEIAPAR
jgi:hypothetical protein